MTVGGPSGSPDLRGPSLFGPRFRAGLREEGARGALVAAASTIVVLGLIVAVVVTSDAWPAVQRQFFDGFHFRTAFPLVLRGFWRDIWMFLVAEAAILDLALLVAIVRALRGPAFFPLRVLAVGFIDVVRGVPMILLILLMGFSIPALQLPGVTNSPLFWGLTAVVLSYSAYTAEVYRAGIESVPESQRMSARSLGLSQMETLRFVIVPQAVRNVVPALLNGFVSLQKDVALIFVLGIREGVREAQIYIARTFNYTPYLAAALLFLVVSIPLARYADWYTERDRRRKQAMST